MRRTQPWWKSQQKEYRQWSGMIQRCTNPSVRCYKNYGGRGITVCEKWLRSYDRFLEDVGKRPGDGYSLERINNDGNYEPGNVRWATPSEQASNRRNTRLIAAFGLSKTCMQWARETGVPFHTIWNRLRSGMHPEDALTRPRGQTTRKRTGRKQSVFVLAFGKNRSLEHWRQLSSLDRSTLEVRLRLGWTPEQAISTPTGKAGMRLRPPGTSLIRMD